MSLSLLTVVNKNPDEDIVVISKSEWDSLQETLRLAQNKELSDKVLLGHGRSPSWSGSTP